MEDKKIRSRYATKMINNKFYNVINVVGEPKTLTDEEFKNGESGYVFVPYIMDDSTVPSEDYDKFMKQYRLDHEVCPECGSNSCMTTLMGYILNVDHKEDYKDLNRCTCQDCDSVHSAHDRISQEEFNKKNNETLE